jgi:hypothetical protein
LAGNHAGYSDRVGHAIAFAAKHAVASIGRGAGAANTLITPANVAVILARHGADETTIVAGILAALLQDQPLVLRGELERKIPEKFGDEACRAARACLEPRYESRGKDRTWDARKMDLLAELAQAERRTLDVCAAREIFLCGSVLTDVRRLGPEYLTAYAPGGGTMLLGWFRDVVLTLERHPTGPRPSLLAELRDLTTRLGADLTAG